MVGWHIDSTQPYDLRIFISKHLASWHNYWFLDMEFSSSMLKQFMEDLEDFSADYNSATDTELKALEDRVLALIQVR